MQELISVIVPAYNAVEYLEECVESILQNDHNNLEVLLVDDGSTDGTAELCDRLARNDSRIRVVHQDNRGLSAARNVGIDNARGIYIAFVDADDIVDSKMFSSLASMLEGDAKLAICQPYICMREDVASQIQVTSDNVHYIHGTEECLVTLNWGVWVWNKLYIREIIEKYNIRFRRECIVSEDQWFNTDYISRISCVAHTNKKLYYHIQTPDSCMSGFRLNRFVGNKFVFVPRGWVYTASHIKDKQSDAYYQMVARAAMFYQTVLRKLEQPDPAFIEEAVSYVRKNKGALLHYSWGFKYYLSALPLCISYSLWARIFRKE